MLLEELAQALLRAAGHLAHRLGEAARAELAAQVVQRARLAAFQEPFQEEEQRLVAHRVVVGGHRRRRRLRHRRRSAGRSSVDLLRLGCKK